MSPDDAKSDEKKIDEGWKARARQEAEKLAEETEEQEPERQPLPEASFQQLVADIATRAMFGMGGFVHPETKERMIDLDLAKYSIDSLQVIADKTQGNLTPQEEEEINSLLYDLRMRYLSAMDGGGAPPSGSMPGM